MWLIVAAGLNCTFVHDGDQMAFNTERPATVWVYADNNGNPSDIGAPMGTNVVVAGPIWVCVGVLKGKGT